MEEEKVAKGVSAAGMDVRVVLRRGGKRKEHAREFEADRPQHTGQGSVFASCERSSFWNTWHISPTLRDHRYGGPHLTFTLNRANLVLADVETLFTGGVGLTSRGIFSACVSGFLFKKGSRVWNPSVTFLWFFLICQVTAIQETRKDDSGEVGRRKEDTRERRN